MGKDTKTPDVPDYLGAALAQGQLGKEASLSTTGLNRPNEVTPFGSRTWSRTSSQPARRFTPAWSGGMPRQVENGTVEMVPQDIPSSYPGSYMTTNQAWMGGSPSANRFSKVDLNSGLASGGAPSAPKQQKSLFGGLTGAITNLVKNPVDALRGGVHSALHPQDIRNNPLDPANVFNVGSTANGEVKFGVNDARAQNPNQNSSSSGYDSNITDYINQSNDQITNPGDWTVTTELSPEQQRLYEQQTGYKYQSGQAANRALSNFENQGDLNYTPDSFSADRDKVTNALYNRSTRLLTPQFDRQEAALKTQLTNQGLMEGTEAYKNALNDLRTNQNTIYQNAADSAVSAGGAEQSRLLQALLQSRQQGLGEAQTLAGNATATMPQFNQYGQASGYQTPDISGALNSSYGANLGNANAQNATNAQNTQAASSAALMAMLYAFSDRRLKSDIIPIGEGFGGLPAYEYTIFGRRERGYMAQEVQAKFPEAVRQHESGFLMVNYGALGGRP